MSATGASTGFNQHAQNLSCFYKSPHHQWSHGKFQDSVTTQTSSQTSSQKQNALTGRAFYQRKSLILLVAREGFEPPTFGL
jgi:hypothetical protein